MHRALHVGNKVTAARVQKRYEDQRQQRLREMRGMVDNRPPPTMGMRHLKVNMKKAEITAQRYDTIERDNRHLLNHMENIGGQRDYRAARSRSLPLLRDPPGGPHRQRVADQINQENALILRRLQHIQPEYRTRDWEDQYTRTAEYVRIKCEYPPPMLPALSRRKGPSRTSLIRLPAHKDDESLEFAENLAQLDEEQLAHMNGMGEMYPYEGDDIYPEQENVGSEAASEFWDPQVQDGARQPSHASGAHQDGSRHPSHGSVAHQDRQGSRFSVGSGMHGDLHPEMDQGAVAEDPHAETRCVFSGTIELAEASHMVEMTTDGHTLSVFARNEYSGQTFELHVDEESHLQLHDEAAGDYGRIAERLQLDGDCLVLE
mmetsp:Transcript_8658/g.19800  ORF Transcript_8658/g.19800 Transcript_8658/m.19800 type:complete len:374 (+) Transcript_8658:107-1228(+)